MSNDAKIIEFAVLVWDHFLQMWPLILIGFLVGAFGRKRLKKPLPWPTPNPSAKFLLSLWAVSVTFFIVVSFLDIQKIQRSQFGWLDILLTPFLLVALPVVYYGTPLLIGWCVGKLCEALWLKLL